jgi:hypothetical protein
MAFLVVVAAAAASFHLGNEMSQHSFIFPFSLKAFR